MAMLVAQHRDATFNISTCFLTLCFIFQLGYQVSFRQLFMQISSTTTSEGKSPSLTNFLCCVSDVRGTLRNSFSWIASVWCFAAGKTMRSLSYRHELRCTCGPVAHWWCWSTKEEFENQVTLPCRVGHSAKGVILIANGNKWGCWRWHWNIKFNLTW